MRPISGISPQKSLQVKEGDLNYMMVKSRWDLEEDSFEIIHLENGKGCVLSAVVHSNCQSQDIDMLHFLMQRFISVLGIETNPEINRKLWRDIQ